MYQVHLASPAYIPANPPTRQPAKLQDTLIAMILDGNALFPKLESAEYRLAKMARMYDTMSLEDDTPQEMHLWVRGYDLTVVESCFGYTGNIAHITIEHCHVGYALRMQKVPCELHHHPHHRVWTFRQPSWQHPILKAARDRHVFEDRTIVLELLALLHQEFIDTTLTASNDRLYTIVFNPQIEGTPVEKLILFPEETENGWRIGCRENKGKNRQSGGSKKAEAVTVDIAAMVIATQQGR